MATVTKSANRTPAATPVDTYDLRSSSEGLRSLADKLDLIAAGMDEHDVKSLVVKGWSKLESLEDKAFELAHRAMHRLRDEADLGHANEFVCTREPKLKPQPRAGKINAELFLIVEIDAESGERSLRGVCASEYEARRVSTFDSWKFDHDVVIARTKISVPCSAILPQVVPFVKSKSV